MPFSLPDVKTQTFVVCGAILWSCWSIVPPVHWMLTTVSNCIGFLFVAWQLATYLTSNFIRPRMSQVEPRNKLVVITGCDSGFGYLGALTLLRAGYRVMAGCLQPNAEGATNLLAEADQIAPGQLIIGALDVTNPESVDAFVRQLTKHLERTPKEQFWALINNAGIARLGLLEWGTFQDHYEHLFNVNVFGVVRMTRRCLPLLRSSPTGAFRIVNVNSFLGRITMQPIASYCASKHASVAFTEGLRRELRPFGGQVISIEPNFFATDLCRLEINEREIERQWTRTDAEVKKAYEKFGLLNVWKTVLGSFLFRSLIERNPQQVADAIARSVTDEQPETRVLVAFGWRKWLILTLNWAPREWTEWFLDAFEYGVKVFK